jgi:serine/threonine protein kinase
VTALQSGDPQWVGRYRLLGRLGSGGMGQVFLGQSPGGRLVAVKLIRADLAADPEFRARFSREVAAARHVSGMYTAAVVDADPDGPQPWLVTAYVPGPSLADAVAGRGPLPIRSVLALAAGLAEGLGAVHAQGMVHRDLKPSNVLLASDGPRIIDFGISRALDATALTRTDLVVGSPGFMSPEQAQGQEVGPASDIFSLGAVLTFAATGEGPFGAGPATSLLYRVVYDPPVTSRLPGQIRPLIEACLAKDPQRRPGTDQLLAELGTAQPAAGWLPWPVSPEVASEPPPLDGDGIPRPRDPAEPVDAPGAGPTQPDAPQPGQPWAGTAQPGLASSGTSRPGQPWAGSSPTGTPSPTGIPGSPAPWAGSPAPAGSHSPRADAPSPGSPRADAPSPGSPRAGLPRPGPHPADLPEADDFRDLFRPGPGSPRPAAPLPGGTWPGAARQGAPQRPRPAGRGRASGPTSVLDQFPGPGGPGRSRRGWYRRLWAVAALVTVLTGAGLTALALTSNPFGSGPVSPPSSAPAVPGARAAVLSYIAAINAHDWRRVWALGGKNLGQSYQQMVAGYRLTAHDDVTSLAVHGDTVDITMLAHETTGAVQSYRVRYVVHHGVITAGHATLLGTG